MWQDYFRGGNGMDFAPNRMETVREIMREDLRLYIRMNIQNTSAFF